MGSAMIANPQVKKSLSLKSFAMTIRVVPKESHSGIEQVVESTYLFENANFASPVGLGYETKFVRSLV